MEKLEPSYIPSKNVKLYSHIGRQMLDTELPHNLAILLLDINPRKIKTYFYTNTCTDMFTTALFLVHKQIVKQQNDLNVYQLMNG